MTTTDIIPDIHGQSAKLASALAGLGWRQRGGSWRHADPGRRLLFLGDFIDRGPDNAGVIAMVRACLDSGRADAIMGNHELNALQFHSRHPETGLWLRPHSEKNLRQHAAFLSEFPMGDPQTRAVLDWMTTLPLWHETPGLRAVHAAWVDSAITGLATALPDRRLPPEALVRATDPACALHHAVEVTAKGPELPLPEGFALIDKDGTTRDAMRLAWWPAGAPSWRAAALSVPDPAALPEGDLPPGALAQLYPPDAPPVFFGHYWLTGTPRLQASNVLCLDYSAGRDGPLVTYRHEPGAPLSLQNLRAHPAPA